MPLDKTVSIYQIIFSKTANNYCYAQHTHTHTRNIAKLNIRRILRPCFFLHRNEMENEVKEHVEAHDVKLSFKFG